MISPSRIITRTATKEDKQKLANLVHFEVHVHRHLDYRPPLDWIGRRPFPILEKQGEIVAALACPPDPSNIAWIRMFASTNHISVRNAWETLWDSAYAELKTDKEITLAAAIPMQNWFTPLLESSDFKETHRVITLAWDGIDLPEFQEKPEIIIRPMILDDLEAVKYIDHASFVSVWQNSQSYLELAFLQSAIATMVEENGRLVGYQISTATPMGGHVARLAVHPEAQCRGIGYTILYDVLSQFKQRGARAVTVNTQYDNFASIGLYKKAGFEITEEEYPIFQLELNK